MILFLGMPRLVAIAHAVIAGTCDVSPRTASQSTLKSLSGSVSNAVGNERSESMREMCGCVSFSVRPNAQVYAPRSSWNVQETSSQTSPPSLSSPLLLFSLTITPSLSLSFSSLCSATALSLSTARRQVFWTETKD